MPVDHGISFESENAYKIPLFQIFSMESASLLQKATERKSAYYVNFFSFAMLIRSID